MNRVPNSRKVLDLLGELHAIDSSRELGQWAVNAFADEIGRDFAVLTGFGPGGGIRSVTLADGIEPSLLPVYGPVIDRYITDDVPGVHLMVAEGAARFCGRITDMVSQTQFEQTPLYNEAYKDLQMRRVLAAIFRTPDGGILGLALGRGGRDFTAGQSETVRIVGRHLELAMNRLLQIEGLRERCEGGTAARFEALREGMQWYFTAIDEPSASVLAHSFGALAGFTVPQKIAQVLSRGAEEEPIRAIDGTSWILRADHSMARQALVHLELASSRGPLSVLTPRELEVLGWVANGKRDSEISVVLGIAPRTVSKHVEHILYKLSCENRAAAAAVFFRTHGGGSNQI